MGTYAVTGSASGMGKATADQLHAPSITGASYKFNKQSDCRDVNQAIEALSAAVADKRSLSSLYAVALLVVFLGYCLISVTTAAFFGSKIKPAANLNWSNYCGVNRNWRSAPEPHESSEGDCPWWAQAIALPREAAFDRPSKDPRCFGEE